MMVQWAFRSENKDNLDPILPARFDENLDKLSDILGGCERIVSTPIPCSFRVLLHTTVYVYCFLFPFRLVNSLGWFNPLIVVFVAYTFVAFEAIADEIEEPFGTDVNDLALNSMCIMIEETISEMAGRKITNSLNNNPQIMD